MDNIVTHLTALSDELDKMGKLRCASTIDSLIQSGSVVKVAQYVGVIGYVLKQNRAMGNCIRKKRVASGSAMQEIVLECLKEYQDGQEYGHNEWTSKYAQVVETCPDRFDDIHLEFIRDVANNNNMDKHIEDVVYASTMLEKNNIKDNMLDTILSNVASLGDILQKEGNSSVNFKLAAPTDRKRGLWDRITNPTDKTDKFWNPFSWSQKRRERGQADEDDISAMKEMDNIIKNISDISGSTQKMKTGINRLKNSASLYSSNNPQQDEKLMNLISSLDTNNWTQNLSKLEQLRPYAAYNPKLSEVLNSIDSDSFVNEINDVYESIRRIQIDMNLLRQRIAIRGRHNVKQNEPDNSPTEEFGALDQVLRKLYQNPFDEKAQYYASRMHGRLDDRLRFAPKQDGNEVQDWLNQSESSDDQTFAPLAKEVQPEQQPVDGELNKLIDNIATNLIGSDVISANDPKSLALQLSMILGGIAANNPTMTALVEKLKEYGNGNAANQSPASGPETSTPTQPTTSPFNPDFFTASINNNDLIKIADIIDPLSRDLANLIDKYIEENSNNELSDLPSFSMLIKENKGYSNIVEQV